MREESVKAGSRLGWRGRSRRRGTARRGTPNGLGLDGWAEGACTIGRLTTPIWYWIYG